MFKSIEIKSMNKMPKVQRLGLYALVIACISVAVNVNESAADSGPGGDPVLAGPLELGYSSQFVAKYHMYRLLPFPGYKPVPYNN